MTILTKNRCNIIFGLDKVLTVDNEIRKFLWKAKLKKDLKNQDSGISITSTIK